VQVPGVARLQRWGLLERVHATNAPPIRNVRFDQGLDLVLDGQFPCIDGADACYSVRRTALDTVLVEEAARAGAEVRQGFTVDEVVLEDGRVTGIRGRDEGGRSVTERATLVVGADGHRSLVAHAVGAPTYKEQKALTCAYYTYFEGVPLERLEIYGRPRRAFGVAPTNDGLVCVFTSWPRAEFDAYRADIEAGFWATTALVPDVFERLRAGRRVERFLGTADLPNFFRKPFGRGWALVGDAGHVLDPLTGQGIADAFRDAEYLSEALDAGLGGRSPLEDALADYEQKRNAAAMPMHDLTLQLASFAPPAPAQLAVLQALRGNQAETNRFLGVISGGIPPQEFFTPATIIRLLGPIGVARVIARSVRGKAA
jgi:2-polyprenyl-6-methoxyphenol hydroxylase-like FAD-dependent oxidoreductase